MLQNYKDLGRKELMVFVILEHTVYFRCYVVAKMIAIPIESRTFTPQNGDVMSKLISVNCITQ